MTALALTTRDPAELPVDALVVGVVSTTEGADVAPDTPLPRKSLAHLQAVLADLDAKGRLGEVHRVVSVPGVRANSVALTGLGPVSGPHDGFALRDAAAAGVRAVRTKQTVAVLLPTPDVAALAAVADGAYGGVYEYDKSTEVVRRPTVVERPRLFVHSAAGQGRAAKDAVARAAVLGANRDFVRDLVNAPPNLLNPATFVEAVRKRAASVNAKVKISVMDEKALAKAGCGGIVGVGQGSVNPPRMVTLTWQPAEARGHVALVGKGITFDTGGVCLKTRDQMGEMKSDMAGAAAVAGAVFAAAELGVPVTVTGYLCLAENMPSGTAQRPGDVVTMRNGTTVEIKDTDAEGRMVLADGLCLATEAQPDAIIDIATLTGSQMVALGHDIAGVMANDDAFRETVHAAAGRGGEHTWPMPLPDSLRFHLESPVADLCHLGDRWGGMLTAGLFLGEFVGDGIPWAHIDMAGPSFSSKPPRGVTPQGGTGWGVATLLGVVEAHGAR